MPYLIDGHNLIPKMPGLSLQAIDDEMQLVALLQDFCRLQRKNAEVYFDGAPPGQPSRRMYGLVTAHFVRQNRTADEAILARLRRLGREAHNWVVVSSDHAVQAGAREMHARFMSSQAFAALIAQTLQNPGQDVDQAATERRELPPSPEEVESWLDLFAGGEQDKGE